MCVLTIPDIRIGIVVCAILIVQFWLVQILRKLSGDEKLEADLRSPWPAGVLALLALLWLSLANFSSPLIFLKIESPRQE